MGSTVEERLAELGIEIVAAPKHVGCYRSCVRAGDLAYLSGHGPIGADGIAITGTLGADLSVEQGYQAARQTAINMLSTLKAEIGELDNVIQIVKLFGLVQSTPEFHDQPKVINGCSELFRDVFGDRGLGARAAVGCTSLPLNWAVEIDGIFRVK